MFSPEMMQQAQKMMQNMSPEQIRNMQKMASDMGIGPGQKGMPKMPQGAVRLFSILREYRY